jgi:hypothetical protein
VGLSLLLYGLFAKPRKRRLSASALPNYIVVGTAVEEVGQKISLKKAPSAERGLKPEG